MSIEVVLGSNTDQPHIGQGKEKARNYLVENPDVCQEIHNKVMAIGGYMEDLAEKLEEVEEHADAAPAN